MEALLLSACEMSNVGTMKWAIDHGAENFRPACRVAGKKGDQKAAEILINLIIRADSSTHLPLAYWNEVYWRQVLYGAIQGAQWSLVEWIKQNIHISTIARDTIYLEWFGGATEQTCHIQPQYDIEWQEAFDGACHGGHMTSIEQLLVRRVDLCQGFEYACKGGHRHAVSRLMSLQRDERNLYFNRGVSGACYGGHKEIVELLLTEPNVDWNWEDLLSCAASGGNVNLIDMMLEHTVGDKNHALACASYHLRLDAVRKLIVCGASNGDKALETLWCVEGDDYWLSNHVEHSMVYNINTLHKIAVLLINSFPTLMSYTRCTGMLKLSRLFNYGLRTSPPLFPKQTRDRQTVQNITVYSLKLLLPMDVIRCCIVPYIMYRDIFDR